MSVRTPRRFRMPVRARTPMRRVLAGDGRGFVLQPWQIAYLFALAEGRPGFVPPGCGVGKGWLDARLREARATGDSASL